jgi:hypothetical protein
MSFPFLNYILYFIFAGCAVGGSRLVQSTAIVDSILPNLTTVVIALLAINVQTTAVIAVKLRELADKHSLSFSASVKEMRFAIYEQGVLAVISLIILALFKAKPGTVEPLAIELATCMTLFASLHIFIDTTCGLLGALFPEDEQK